MSANNQLRIERYADPGSVADALAGAAISVLRARQQEGAVPCIVLTGGSMGEASLAALGTHPERDSVDWRRVHFLWGDERWKPAGDAERNDKLADDTLFARVETDPALVHRVAPSNGPLDIDEAAAAYAEIVDGIERIDVSLCGVGPDGHVASLFPGRAELDIVGADAPSAIAVLGSPKPPPERVSLTFPALARAEHQWLLITGAGKADALAGLLEPAEPSLPVARVGARRELVLWADDAAFGD